jgi:orotidine-5'-phosphate decarboxylase
MDSTRRDAARDRLILALDVPTLDDADALYQRLAPWFGWFKVGLELFSAHGPAVFDRLPASRVFLDVKYHDIPNTVAGASRAAAGLGVWMFNVHASGGRAMMEAARRSAEEVGEASGRRPLVIAVTVLSSIDSKVWNGELGLGSAVEDQVVRNAVLARESGLDGVVASAPEVARIREACGQDFVIMTPGIRPAGSARGDQRRVMTPAEAIAAGSTYLGIGRPVTASPDPEAAAEAILQEVAGALENGK